MLTRRQAMTVPVVGALSGDNETRKLEQKIDKLEERLNQLARDNPPVGSVAAFAGAWPPPVPPKEGGQPRIREEAELFLGWLACDGRTLDRAKYPELFAAIGTTYNPRPPEPQVKPGEFKLPDYRGYFLRGLDSGAGRDGGGRVLGAKPQEDTTRMPRNAFSTQAAGEHRHPLSTRFNEGTDINRNGAEITTHATTMDGIGACGAAGNHTHGITGGDAETRPANMAVNWIIKCM